MPTNPPVCPDDFKAVIPDPQAGLCESFVKALIQLPKLIWQWMDWAMNDDCTASDDLKNWVAGGTTTTTTGGTTTAGTTTAATTTSAPVGAEALFNTPGTYSWVVPAGVTNLTAIEMGAAGGGGGYGLPSPFDVAGTLAVGGGGGAGEHRRKTNISVTPLETLTIVVPSGGAVDTNALAGQASFPGGNAQVLRGATIIMQANGGSGGVKMTSTIGNTAAGGAAGSGGFGGTLTAGSNGGNGTISPHTPGAGGPGGAGPNLSGGNGGAGGAQSAGNSGTSGVVLIQY